MNILTLSAAIFICLLSCKNGTTADSPVVFSRMSGTEIVRGNDLSEFSEVAFYYDSLRKSQGHDKNGSLSSGDLPEVMFVPGWGEWICNEERFGHKAVVTDTIPGSDDVHNEEYEAYLLQSENETSVNDNFIKIQTNEQVMKDYLNITEIKLFHDDHNNITIGLSISNSSRDNGEHIFYGFYTLRKGSWEKTIVEIPGEDDAGIFFRDSVDLQLVHKYNWIRSDVEFDYPGDTIHLKPYFITDLDCYTLQSDSLHATGTATIEKLKLCGYADQLNMDGIPFVLDKKKMIFRRADPLKKIKTN